MSDKQKDPVSKKNFYQQFNLGELADLLAKNWGGDAGDYVHMPRRELVSLLKDVLELKKISTRLEKRKKKDVTRNN